MTLSRRAIINISGRLQQRGKSPGIRVSVTEVTQSTTYASSVPNSLNSRASLFSDTTGNHEALPTEEYDGSKPSSGGTNEEGLFLKDSSRRERWRLPASLLLQASLIVKKDQKFFFIRRTLDAKRQSERAILEYLMPHLHQALWRIASLSFDKGSAGIMISVREREVLNWIKEGKTSWEISKILRISERTVNFHVHNILSKLQATSRGHALAIAMGQKIIAP